MAGRPLIGVSTYLESGARWGVWELEAALLPAGYPRLVQRAGGLAAMLPQMGYVLAFGLVVGTAAVLMFRRSHG